MSVAYSGGLNFTWPVKKDTNWDSVVDAALTKISAHDHSGGGNGVQISSAAFASDSIPGTKIRLANAEYLRGRNAANSGDVNIVRVTAGSQPEYQGTSTNDAATAGAIGEQVGPISRLLSAATAVTTATTLNVTVAGSITLSPGDWWVSAAVGFAFAGTTSVTQLFGAVSKTSATLPSTDTEGVPIAGEYTARFSTAANVMVNNTSLAIPTYRVSVSTSTPIFLVARAVFSVSTTTCYGYLLATRCR